MRKVLEKIITDARCHDGCPDKVKVDMIQIFLEMSLLDHSIDQKSAFIVQLKEILHPLQERSTGDQENSIKEEPVDYIEEPVANKRPRHDRTLTRTANQNQSVTQMEKVPERNNRSSPGVATSKEHSKTPRSFSKPDLSPLRSLNNSLDNKGSSVPPALPTKVTNERRVLGGLTNERSQNLDTPESRAADLSKLKKLKRGDVIWVTKPSGEQITCKFLKIHHYEKWKVQVETETMIGGRLKIKTPFLYLSVCQWGTVES